MYAGRTSKPYKGFKANRRIEFKNDDLLDIQLNFPFYLERITPIITRSENVKHENESNQYTVRAVGPANQYMEKTIMMLGRYINATDVNEKIKILLLGEKLQLIYLIKKILSVNTFQWALLLIK